MNHQNQLEQMANGAMFATPVPPLPRRRALNLDTEESAQASFLPGGGLKLLSLGAWTAAA
jgi:hypothetical protein